MLLLGAMGIAWSGQSLAQTCDFVTIGSVNEIGLPGTNVSFTIEAQTACAPTVNVSLVVNAGDGTGGATIVPPANPTLTLDTPYTFSVTLGPNPGGTGTVTATCLSGGCAGDTQVLTFRTNNDFDFTPTAPLTVVTNQISSFTVGTNLLFNGAPGGLSTNYSNLTTATGLGAAAPDGAGTTTLTNSIVTAGSYVIRGSLACPIAVVLEGCAAVPPVDYTVQVQPVSVTPVSPVAPSTPTGTPLVLTVAYGSPSLPAPNGSPMTWTITAQPPGGDGAVTGAPVAGGQSSATFSATVLGTYTVVANSGCTFCAVAQQAFNVTVTAVPFVLSPTTPAPANGVVGAPIPFGVQLTQGGVPVAGADIAWTATAPFAPAGAVTTTNAAGTAGVAFTPSAAGTFPGAVTALYDPDGVAGSGDEASFAFDATVLTVPGLAIVSGNNQNALVGSAFAQPLTVIADDSGAPAVGVAINWTVVGDATLVAGGPTNGSGQASATVTAGPTAGAITVTAARQDAPTTSVSFTLNAEALGALLVVSGDGQTLAAGSASEPLVVELRNAAGLPVPGASIAWAADTGELAAASSVTDASGRASNTITLAAAGPVEISASSPLAENPAVFSLKGALAGLPGLQDTGIEAAKAIDRLCPALAALPSRTPGQQDLLERCEELSRGAAIDPAAAVAALDQLMANVALAQANAGLSAAQSQFQNLKTRIAALRSGTGGTRFGGLALNTPSGPLSLGLLATALSGEDSVAEVGGDFSRWGFFGAGNIGRGEADGGAVDPAYDYDIEGLTFGVDYRWSDRWILGGSFGITRQDTDLPQGRGGLETSGWSVSGYTTYYQPDSWYVDGVLTWGRNDYEMLRRIQYTLPQPGGGTVAIDQEARSDSKGDLLSAAFTFGRDFNRGAWGLGPYARMLFTRLDFDAIDESLDSGPGNGLGLHINSRSVDSLASVLGGKLTYTASTDWGVLMPHLQLEWEHEFQDDPQALEARFINDPSGTAMVLEGDPLDTDYFRIGLGMSMVLTRGRSGFFYYERLVGRNGSSQYNLALGFRMEF